MSPNYQRGIAKVFVTFVMLFKLAVKYNEAQCRKPNLAEKKFIQFICYSFEYVLYPLLDLIEFLITVSRNTIQMLRYSGLSLICARNIQRYFIRLHKFPLLLWE